MNTITKKWKDIGFMEGINDKFDASFLAYKFEIVDIKLKSDRNKIYSKDVSFLIFPVIRRIFNVWKNFDVLHLLKDFSKFMKNSDRLDPVDLFTEAELIVSYCNDYIFKNKKIKIEPLKFVTQLNFR